MLRQKTEEESTDLVTIKSVNYVPSALLLDGLKRKLLCKHRVNLGIYHQSFPTSDKDPKGSSHLDKKVKREDISELRNSIKATCPSWNSQKFLQLIKDFKLQCFSTDVGQAKFLKILLLIAIFYHQRKNKVNNGEHIYRK